MVVDGEYNNETDGSNEKVGRLQWGGVIEMFGGVWHKRVELRRESAACRTLLVSTWNLGANWGEGGVTSRGGGVAGEQTYSVRERWCWRW